MGNVVGDSSADVQSIAQDSRCGLVIDENFLSDGSSGQMIETGDNHTPILAPIYESGTSSVSISHTQRDCSISSEPCNNSSPLLNSELPDTFDISLNSADVSDFSAEPSEVNTEAIAHQEVNNVESTSEEIEPISIRYSDDSKLQGSAGAEQFSRLDSTVTNILACPTLVLSAASAQDPPRSLDPEQMITNSEYLNSEIGVHPTTQSPYVQESCESNGSLVTHISGDLPLQVTTYADATNLAKKYPELAKEILAHPLPEPSQQTSSPKMDQPLSSSLHHPDRPHWAAAPLEIANKQPTSAKSSQDEHAVSWKPTKARGSRSNRAGTVNSSSRGARRDGRGSVLDPGDERHERSPQHKGNRRYNRLVSDIPLFERLSGSSKAWANNSGGDNDDTGTSRFETQDWHCGPSAANNSDTRLNTSLGHSDVGAYQEISNDWESTGANLWNDVPNATSPDDTYQQTPFKSGPDRLGRHVISPHTIDTIPEQHRTSRRVHKQQVSDLNTATLRYLRKGSTTSDLEQRTSSSSDWGIETAENPEGILDQRVQRLSYSVAHNSIQFQRNPETSAEEPLTSKLPSDTYPFRDIQIQTINSPQVVAVTPYCYSFDSKPELSLAPQLQEDHTLSNAFHGSANDWLPVQHTAEDWLPPQASQNLASTQRPHLVNASDVYTPLEPAADGNSHDVTPSYGLGRESHPNRSTSTNRFGGVPARDLSLGNGPRPESKLLGYTRRSRESLPAQTEAFAQYLAETYYSSKNNGRGRGWRAGGRGARGSSTSCAQPCRNSYGPRNDPESEIGAPVDSSNLRKPRV